MLPVAIPVSVTVPVAVAPLAVVAGAIENAAISASASESVAVRLVPFRLAVTVAVVPAIRGAVVIGNVADELPAGTVTDEGTVTAVEFEESWIATFDAAIPDSVTVPVADP